MKDFFKRLEMIHAMVFIIGLIVIIAALIYLIAYEF